MTGERQLCSHCGHTNEHWDEFCLACGERLTSVQREGRIHQFLRWLGVVKPPDPPPPNRDFYREVYRKGPINHGEP